MTNALHSEHTRYNFYGALLEAMCLFYLGEMGHYIVISNLNMWRAVGNQSMDRET